MQTKWLVFQEIRQRCHPGKTKEDNLNNPCQNPIDRRLVATTDRHCQPCKVFGCRYYNVPISRLDRHARKIHGTKPPSKENRDSVLECSFSDEEGDEEERNDSLSVKIAGILQKL